MDSEKAMPKLLKPSGLKPPQVRVPKSQIPSMSVGPTSSRAFLRRSKSVADLHFNPNKNGDRAAKLSKLQKVQVPAPVPKKVQVTAPVPKKVPQKRKADNTGDEVKSKVVKQVKIPDWDYKGRYNQLREKHTTLNEEYKKQQNKIEEFDVLEEKFNTIKNDYTLLDKKYTNLNKTNSETIKENEKLKQQVSELQQSVESISKECQDTKCDLEKFKSENELLLKENKKLQELTENLNTELSNLKDNHRQLTQEHDELVKAHDTLQKETSKVQNENEKLNLEIKLKTHQITKLSDQNSQLKQVVNNGEILRRQLHNTIQDLKGNIRVFCRVRPPIGCDEEERPLCNINFIDEKTIEIKRSRESISTISGKPTDIKAEFTVDKIFEPRSSQEEIFEDLSQLVQSALDGYDVCVFAYGQTGSGKTYTMQGEDSPEKKGMIPRTVDLIFNSIEHLKNAGWKYEISASFLEIYNENVRDLLNPNPNQSLEIRFNEGRGMTVTNLTIADLTSAKELKDLMESAQRNRAVAATNFNEHSSRSHAVTKIYLQSTNRDMNFTYRGSINLVDLAGSESAKTSSTERLAETKNINKSLSALEGVMMALYNKERHIPYRNSKLTYLLQSSLGGNSKTLMVVNIAPFEECYTESVYSLRFAAKVKEVKMTIKRNKTNNSLQLPSGKT